MPYRSEMVALTNLSMGMSHAAGRGGHRNREPKFFKSQHFLALKTAIKALNYAGYRKVVSVSQVFAVRVAIG
jgi:hypothetical protein